MTARPAAHRWEERCADLWNGRPDAISDAELVAVLLHVEQGESRWAKAAALISPLGTVRSLLTARRETTRTLGLDDTSYLVLQAAIELSMRLQEETMKGTDAVNHLQAMREFLRMRLRDLRHEVFMVVYLDDQNRVQSYSELFRGTLAEATVHAREVVKEALMRNAQPWYWRTITSPVAPNRRCPISSSPSW